MLELAWPWVFLLAPLPWLLRAWLPPSESGEAALKITFLAELEQLSGQRARLAMPDFKAQAPYLLLWALLLVAGARPQWLGEPLPLPASGRDLLLAVDVSGSMDYADMQWQGESVSRLELVQQLFADFVENRRGDRVGLILFGSKAYLQAPLTFDRRTVRTWLEEASVGIAGSNTAIGDAIGLSIKRLRDRPADSRVLVLITDGANNGGELDPLVAARLAARERVRIHTIGIGAPPQIALSGLGFNPALELDEPTLRAIADVTGGRYFLASSAEELKAIGAALDELEPAIQEPEQARVVTALYPWPLALALFGSLALVARRLWPRRATRGGRA